MIVDFQTLAANRASDRLRSTALGLVAAAGVALLAYLCVEVPRAHGQVAPIWLANGFLAALLLSAPARLWSILLASGFIGAVAAAAHAGDSPLTIALLVPANLAQTWLAAFAVRRLTGEAIDLAQPRDMLAFVLVGGIAAPLIAAPPAALIHTLLRGGDLLTNVVNWTLGDILGMLTITPCLLVLIRARTYLRERPLTRDGVLAILFCCAVTGVVFAQSRYPLLFLVPPAMLLVAWRQEVVGAALSAVFVAMIAVPLTMAGAGPITLMAGGASAQSTVLQLFLALSTFVCLPVAALQRQQRSTLARLVETSAAAELSEARYRLLAENALDIIARSDLDGRMTYMSPATRTILGYEPDELLGWGYMKALHSEDISSIADLVLAQREANTRGETLAITVEYRAFRKDGAMIWLESRPMIACDSRTGAPVGVTDIIRDISARKALEMELRGARVEAEAAAVVKGEFLANMSHELRTPLTAVIGFANLLADEAELGERSRRYVDRIATGGQTLLTTINDILDFSRLEQGRITLQPRPVAVTDLIADVLEILTSSAQEKQLALRSVDGEAMPERVILDPERVRQVLLNLVGNAVKFTEVGEVVLEAAYDNGKGRLRMSVIDTGPGVGEADQALIFTRFAQIDGALNREHGGAGLGLAISRGLVELMGGEIGVTSSLGQGARFWFEIPAAVVSTQAAQGDEEAPDFPMPPPGRRVLVVDDNAGNRELVRSVLEAVGVEVAEAVDGEDGVAAARAAPYDAILMDLRMPRLDGVAAALRIRAESGPSARAPIIAFSADVRAGPLDPVFDGATPKPLTVMSLLSTLAQALEPPEPVTA
jgi:PAS domain S-box-containing protein